MLSVFFIVAGTMLLALDLYARELHVELLRTLIGHSHWVSSVAFSPDGGTLASGSWDNRIKMRRVSDGFLLRTLVGQ